ncbi:MAG: Hpt domain-containing protein, partial [Proteobacteria bacterium]|nr:Hpt domain-containing protein [Pseudomonadota bacterium]
MRNEIEKILNDISENLVLLDSTDEIGISEITKSLETFADKLGAAKEFQRLEQSCRKVLAQHNKISNLEFVEQLNNFISKAQSFLNSPDKIKLPFEDVSLESIETSSNAVEYVGELDQSLVIEFIERYNTLLEECESVLVDYNLNLVDEGNKNQDKLNAEFQAYIKGFIHSLKGDAGSVGLIGIERLCHELEDEFIKHAPHLLIDQLALLKEWLAGFVNALSNGTMPEESSERFLEKIKNQITELNAAHTPVVELTPEMEVKTEKSNNDIPINLDLLAQVMNDPTLTSAAEPVPTAPSKANDVQINMELLAMVMNDTTLTSAPAVEEKKVEVVVEETHKPELSTNAYKLTGEVEIFLEFAVEAE